MVKTVAEYKEGKIMEDERLIILQEKAKKYDIIKEGYKNAVKEIERLQEENQKLHLVNTKLAVENQRLWAQLDAKR